MNSVWVGVKTGGLSLDYLSIYAQLNMVIQGWHLWYGGHPLVLHGSLLWVLNEENFKTFTFETIWICQINCQCNYVKMPVNQKYYGLAEDQII